MSTKQTTVKPIALHYGDVAAANPSTPLMGVLKGLTLNQDDPDATEIESEFSDSPFDIFYDGKPAVLDFELVNFALSDLPPLFGGTYDAETDTYTPPASAFTSEHSWLLTFQRGFNGFYIFKGKTVGTVKKDADGALSYHVIVTSLTYNDGENDLLYKIIGTGAAVTYTAVSTSIEGYSEKNPKTEGWYEKDGAADSYRKTWDTAVVTGKTYYTKS
jgi:hypothetical protein